MQGNRRESVERQDRAIITWERSLTVDSRGNRPERRLAWGLWADFTKLDSSQCRKAAVPPKGFLSHHSFGFSPVQHGQACGFDVDSLAFYHSVVSVTQQVKQGSPGRTRCQESPAWKWHHLKDPGSRLNSAMPATSGNTGTSQSSFPFLLSYVWDLMREF